MQFDSVISITLVSCYYKFFLTCFRCSSRLLATCCHFTHLFPNFFYAIDNWTSFFCYKWTGKQPMPRQKTIMHNNLHNIWNKNKIKFCYIIFKLFSMLENPLNRVIVISSVLGPNCIWTQHLLLSLWAMSQREYQHTPHKGTHHIEKIWGF